MRTFLETAEPLRFKFLDLIAEEYDFFIYTTKRKDWRYKRGNNQLPPLLSTREWEFLHAVYDPKRIVVDGKDFDTPSGHRQDNGRNRSAMLDRLKSANDLRKEYEIESGVKYDQVIRMRPDQLVLVDFDDISHIQKDKLGLLSYGRVHGGYSDTFAMGPPEIMDVYSSVGDFMHYYHGLGNANDCKIELILMEYLKESNISTYWLPLQLLIKRINGDSFWFHDQPGAEDFALSTGRSFDWNINKFVECDPVPMSHKKIVERLANRKNSLGEITIREINSGSESTSAVWHAIRRVQ
jgi:hypothetical protein